ncbi:MAG: nucleoside deaminase, partial [Candidatus Marinimicrobia bacterium]|nr:nucleoside deaminase [Candidatus Neomarinimicrobiota bacterium]
KALQLKEVPVGAIIVKDNKVIGRGYNQKEQLNDPTAHAEIVAMTAAANTLEDWRLNDCVLYVTKEPCSMCAGAILNARLKLVVFGCYDEEEGCCGSLYQLCGDPRFKTKVSVMGGVMESQSLSLIKDFFIKSRKKV